MVVYENWGVYLKVQAAYNPSRNSIIEKETLHYQESGRAITNFHSGGYGNFWLFLWKFLVCFYWYNVLFDNEGASPMSKLHNYTERLK